MDLFIKNANTLMGIASVVTLGIVGFFALTGIFNKAKKDKEDESNKVDDRLIKLLKDQVDALEKKVNALEEQSQMNVDKITKLETRNELLEEIFQGRDKNTQEFQKQGFEAMKKSDLILEGVATTNKNMERLTKAIEKHLTRMETIATTETTVTVAKKATE